MNDRNQLAGRAQESHDEESLHGEIPDQWVRPSPIKFEPGLGCAMAIIVIRVQVLAGGRNRCVTEAIVTNIDDIMGNDHVILKIYSGLHVVADHSRATPAGCHRARVRILQRDLAIGSRAHQRLDFTELLHLRFSIFSFR
jgi:hypothetical protein